jgi:quercetin dioxygenase-like cupin family protein
MYEGAPEALESLKIWNQVGKATGAEAISLRILEFGPGLSPPLHNSYSDEVLYVLKPVEAEVIIDQQPFALTGDTAIFLEPGRTLRLRNPADEPITVVSCRCPDEGKNVAAAPSNPAVLSRVPIVRLADRRAQPTADRWYRVNR